MLHASQRSTRTPSDLIASGVKTSLPQILHFTLALPRTSQPISCPYPRKRDQACPQHPPVRAWIRSFHQAWPRLRAELPRHPVAEDIFVLNDDVALVNLEPELNPGVHRH